MNEALAQDNPTTEGTAKVVYILYMIGVAAGVTGVIGVVLAMMNRGDAPDWLKTHYQFQIRTFWIGGLYLLIGALLSVVVIGWFVIAFWFVWLLVRSAKGMKALEAKQPHPNPTGWFF